MSKQRWINERRQISKALKVEGIAGEDIAPVAFVLAAIRQLQAELDEARNQLIEYEQTEAAVCPEDVGIREYVQSLVDKNKWLRDGLISIRKSTEIMEARRIAEQFLEGGEVKENDHEV